jgi:TonB family protein
MTLKSILLATRIVTLLLCALGLRTSVLHASPADEGKHPVNLDALASALDAGMRKANITSVTVADFLGTDGRGNELTWYISGKLSDALRKDIAERSGPRFVSRSALADSKITVEEMHSPEAFARVGDIWGVAAIVTGSVEFSADKYVVKAVVRRVVDGSIIVEAAQDFPHNRILDLLSTEGKDQELANLKTIGVDGVTVPICVYCPIAEYSQDARDAKLQNARLTLLVTVSTKGEPIKVAVTKDPGFGLGEKAIEGVSEWKFQPAMQKGKPVTVAVPVEVTFSM